MIIEERGKTKEGFEYIIGVHMQLGHRMGYVGVFEDSPLYGRDYSEDKDEESEYSSVEHHIHVHGGVTYSGPLQENIIGAKNPFYFGFDCGHLDDGKIDPDEMSELINSHLHKTTLSKKQKLIKDYAMMYNMFPDFGSITHIRDLEYVKNECKHLSSQLKELEDEYGNV